MWAIGIVQLFSTTKTFEIMVDLMIIVAAVLAAILLTKIKPAND